MIYSAVGDFATRRPRPPDAARLSHSAWATAPRWARSMTPPPLPAAAPAGAAARLCLASHPSVPRYARSTRLWVGCGRAAAPPPEGGPPPRPRGKQQAAAANVAAVCARPRDDAAPAGQGGGCGMWRGWGDCSHARPRGGRHGSAAVARPPPGHVPPSPPPRPRGGVSGTEGHVWRGGDGEGEGGRTAAPRGEHGSPRPPVDVGLRRRARITVRQFRTYTPNCRPVAVDPGPQANGPLSSGGSVRRPVAAAAARTCVTAVAAVCGRLLRLVVAVAVTVVSEWAPPITPSPPHPPLCPASFIVPAHRVIGTTESVTAAAAGRGLWRRRRRPPVPDTQAAVAVGGHADGPSLTLMVVYSLPPVLTPAVNDAGPLSASRAAPLVGTRRQRRW